MPCSPSGRQLTFHRWPALLVQAAHVLSPTLPLSPSHRPTPQDLMHLRSLIQRHVKYTNSTVGRRILLDWDAEHKHFVKVGRAGCGGGC